MLLRSEVWYKFGRDAFDRLLILSHYDHRFDLMFNRLKMLDRVEFCGATSKSWTNGPWTSHLAVAEASTGNISLLFSKVCAARLLLPKPRDPGY